ncbi:MAG: HD domain-containing protein [Chlorobi bacterium]|nr:HD domain-containing protein [Chlorobiota bacterium]
MKLKIEVDILREIGRLADEKSTEVYVVGGYVRDVLRGLACKDYDIMVVGDGIAFAKLVQEQFGKGKLVIHEKFRTARLFFHDETVEFVGTRKETYRPESRKPDVTIGTLEDDLRRRDFTVNALAAALNLDRLGEVIDVFDGIGDIERKVLRTPLDPEQTFSEDPLRMMRAFRFQAQLGFEVDPQAFSAIQRIADRLTVVSQERITDEFLKLLSTSKPSVGLIPMYEAGVLKYVLPELEKLGGVDQKSVDYPDGVRNYQHKDVLYHSFEVLDNVAAVSTDTWLRLAALLHDIAKPKTKAFREDVGWTFYGHAELGAKMIPDIFKRLRLPMNRMKYVRKLVYLHLRPIALVQEQVTDSAVRRLLFDAGEDIDDLMLLCKADVTTKNPSRAKRYRKNYKKLMERLEAIESRDRLRNWQPPLRGEDIMEICGIEPGIAVGVLKVEIENAILEGKIPNEYEAAKEYLLSIKDSILSQKSLSKKKSLREELDGLPAKISGNQ